MRTVPGLSVRTVPPPASLGPLGQALLCDPETQQFTQVARRAREAKRQAKPTYPKLAQHYKSISEVTPSPYTRP